MYFTNLHLFFNTSERANLSLELFLFHPCVKIIKTLDAPVEVREKRTQESFQKYPSTSLH